MKKQALLLFQLFAGLTLSAQTYTTSLLNLRTSPKLESEVLTVIPKSTEVTPAGRSDGAWTPVSYAGYTGYVSSKYLTNTTTGRTPSKYYTNSSGERVQSPTYYKAAPAGATALCRDGTYSFSRSRRGTCSHHGGVARWLR